MKVLSLFDGISVGQLALKELNVSVKKYYASEVDSYAISVTSYNFPNTIFVGDVRNIKSDNFLNIDLLIGGSPCQNFSFAGKRNGMTTKENIEITSLEQYLKLKNQGFEFEGQSYLFWEYVRLLKETKPKYFLLENVKMANKWKNLITDILGVESVELDSGLVSGQRRKRLYWVGVLTDNGYKSVKISKPKDKNILFKDILDNSMEFREIPKCFYGNFGKNKRIDSCNWVNNKKSNTITTNRSHTTQYLLNKDKTKCRLFTVKEVEQLQTLPIDYTKYGIVNNQIKEIPITHRYKLIGNSWTKEIIKHILSKTLNKGSK